jgi:hypothetical protein
MKHTAAWSLLFDVCRENLTAVGVFIELAADLIRKVDREISPFV